MLVYGPAIPSLELKALLDLWLADKFPVTPNQAQMLLFKNNVTVSQTTLLGDLTLADFTGFTSKVLPDFSLWSPAALDANGNVSRVAPGVITFTASTPNLIPNTIYGFLVVDQLAAELIACGNFPTPLDFTLDGATVSIELGMRVVAGGALVGFDAEYGVVI